MDEEDYRRYDDRLRRQAIGLMQQIEQIAPESAHLDAGLEAEIAHRRKVHEAAPLAGMDLSDSLEQEIAARRKVQAKPAAPAARPAQAPAAGNGKPVAGPAAQAGATRRFCTNCGTAIEANHKFCANCGTPVAAPSLAADGGG